MKIAIDAGHGSNTAGKRTPSGYREHYANVVVANYLYDILKSANIIEKMIAYEDDTYEIISKDFGNIRFMKAEDSFINDKEIRICGEEDGYPVQIKVTLTAAKENIDNPNEVIRMPQPTESANTVEVSITSEEKKTVAQLLAGLGL